MDKAKFGQAFFQAWYMFTGFGSSRLSMPKWFVHGLAIDTLLVAQPPASWGTPQAAFPGWDVSGNHRVTMNTMITIKMNTIQWWYCMMVTPFNLYTIHLPWVTPIDGRPSRWASNKSTTRGSSMAKLGVQPVSSRIQMAYNVGFMDGMFMLECYQSKWDNY